MRRSFALISTTSVIATGDRPSDTPVALGRGGSAASSSSTRLDHSWHAGQRPSQRDSAWPHD
jgi:hypothetical protein